MKTNAPALSPFQNPHPTSDLQTSPVPKRHSPASAAGAASRPHQRRQITRSLVGVVFLGLVMSFAATAQTIDFGKVLVGNVQVGETEKISFRAFPHECMHAGAGAASQSPDPTGGQFSPVFLCRALVVFALFLVWQQGVQTSEGGVPAHYSGPLHPVAAG